MDRLKLTRNSTDTRTEIERLHDAIETAEDTVEAAGKKLTPEEVRQRAQQIGEEVQSRPKDSEPRNPEYLATKLNELNLSHDEAVEATIVASETAFGENAGTAPARDGGTVLLPASTHHKLVMIIKPDGTVVAARGNVTDFL